MTAFLRIQQILIVAIRNRESPPRSMISFRRSLPYLSRHKDS